MKINDKINRQVLINKLAIDANWTILAAPTCTLRPRATSRVATRPGDAIKSDRGRRDARGSTSRATFGPVRGTTAPSAALRPKPNP
jgi:hypothetical protein